MWAPCSILVHGVWSQWQNWGRKDWWKSITKTLRGPAGVQWAMALACPCLPGEQRVYRQEAGGGPDLLGPAVGHGQPIQAQGGLEDALC